jgi:hypothetical protein
MPKETKPKGVCDGDTPLTPITAKERRKLDKSIKQKYDRFRRRYPEVHGKVVDFITHSTEDGTLYFSVRFKDKTDFSLRYACDMFVVGADFCDFKTGDFEMIREYMRPIPRQRLHAARNRHSEFSDSKESVGGVCEDHCSGIRTESY